MRQLQALTVLSAGGSVFLTGAPGAGKTYVLNEFIRRSEIQGRRVAVTASTGIAATHISGVTIHSWSGLGIRDSLKPADREQLRGNARLRERYLNTDVLVIDEVSMLHGQRLDLINEVCKLLRDSNLPFGGLQIVLVGDLFQLPPVSQQTDAVDFVHLSKAWQELDLSICYLTEQHRQQDDLLLSILEAMRHNEIEEEHRRLLLSRFNQHPPAGQAVTRLYAHNVDVDALNQQQLSTLPTTPKIYTMQFKGRKSKIEQLVRGVLAPEILELKVGAEVMFVTNDFAKGFVNGSRGRIEFFENDLPVVKLLTGNRTIKVEPHGWSLNEDGRSRAEAVQLPLRLAWAITIHKSQGMSLDAADIDLSKSFTPGMGYVALSRVRTLNGLYLGGLNAMALGLHPDIYELDYQLRQASERLGAITPDAPEELLSPEVVLSVRQIDKLLLNDLRAWRLVRARRDRVAPFMVAHNSLLENLARYRPLTANTLLSTKGFGPSKLAAYGDELLAILVAHQTAAGEGLPKDN